MKQEIQSDEKQKMTFLMPEALDKDAYLEDFLIEDEQTKIILKTIFYCIIILTINYIAW